MDYTKHYDLLIERARNRISDEYTEAHHIIPKCMGGNDELSNIANLTPREHFIAHILLVKKYPSDSKLIFALRMMTVGSKLNSRNLSKNRMYGWLRTQFQLAMKESQTGTNNSQYGKRWIVKDEIAKKVISDEVDKYISDGWVLGRVEKLKPRKVYKRKAKPCGRCGHLICGRPDICRKTNMIKTLIIFFGFDDSKLGSKEFYTEFDRIVNLVQSEYHENMLSTLEIAEKYNLPSTQRVDSIFKSLGIKKRTLSEAGVNYYRAMV